ncbi:RsmB/NOP family class I SAM-dependent RNA methyltransferase [Tabrizicola sp. J26]|uniref:RsmB/NOP family class I SAM-dependent RNA methyltransferase n=1 Tax=Alitabrizicola rongguiensis TaxID=2909234 RepID=UPI001F383CD5|nr:RsmB/NOP family class I SAM-dependent RNA methyltransferase [Tabrizicola rongguiensis]MCF1709860.1 RsmB/NOP family class I SAM-dependent RNA methyltransferase [Tabrizicola rongguiensis]
MTPAARAAAAIEILDRVLAGAPAEQTLTNWARASRFAGSGDRHAIRDLVFDALRRRRSFAALGGSESGRGLILGGIRAAGADPATIFNGAGHAPAPLSEAEQGVPASPTGLAALDCPDWLAPLLQRSLGRDFPAVMEALRHRAPVFVRVNSLRAARDQAIAALKEEGIVALPHPLASTALEVAENARKIQASQAYSSGLVELQDAASQAVVEALPLADGQRVLDYCAGGGGKTLAMAARARLRLWAHDIDPRRLRDLPDRAARAEAKVALLEGKAVDREAPFDLVLTDVPCSGSGSWRRAPEAKWTFSEARLAQLLESQAAILDRASGLVGEGGSLAYATCSMIDEENGRQVERFLQRHPDWYIAAERRLTPLDGGDGFYLAVLGRN